MQLVSTVTVGAGGAASIEFTSIPQTGTDLVLKASLRNSVNNGNGNIAFNTGGTYTRRRLVGTGSSVSSDTLTPDFNVSTSVSTANTFGNVAIYIPNYTGSTAKSYSVDSVNENNATLANQLIVAGLWDQTSAITSITLTPLGGGTLTEGSTASLYIITKA
jgi:hypothetical protein